MGRGVVVQSTKDDATEHGPAPLPGRNSETADSGGSRHRLMSGMRLRRKMTKTMTAYSF